MSTTYSTFRPVRADNPRRLELAEVVVCENSTARVERIVRRGGPWRWIDGSICPAGVYAAEDAHRRRTESRT